ncbi:MAG: biotin--[acetyl-CoA-carboxylase] ligase [Parachlamydiaceae bacterium]|nr:biotin--[acetyl-CoA-carboxylase] ligase [Parachlamydiaceae bacterium]
MQLFRRHFKVIDSTNTWAKQNAHLFPKEAVTLVTADEQTAGRGRFNRKWESLSGQNVLATFCFFIEKHRKDIGNIPQVMALSAAHMLEELGLHPTLKWPNDVLLSGKKIAGILAETTSLSDQLCFILGIGLNVNMPLESAKQIDRPATSLLIESHHSYDVEDILENLQKHFTSNLENFLEEGFYPFLEEYRRRISSDSNQIVRFDDSRSIWEGTFDSINLDGSYNLKLKNREIKNFLAGEIMW